MLKTIILLCITLFVLFAMYIRVKFKFWAIQPVFHLYDLNHWLFPNRIIQTELPTMNAYVDRFHIHTYNLSDTPECILQSATQLIQNHYLRTKSIEYIPSKEDIFQHPYNSFLSVYTTNLLSLKTCTNDNPMVPTLLGVITARPLNITLNKTVLKVHYIDNLTVDIHHRKEGIAPKLIQTHHYHIRQLVPDTKICLFKREGDMTAIVPLLRFNISGYDLKDIIHLPTPFTSLKLNRIDKHNFNDFKTFCTSISKRFRCCIHMDSLNVYDLILKEKLIIYGLFNHCTPVCYYVFRPLSCTMDYDKPCIELITTLNDTTNSIFFKGFQSSCKRIMKKYKVSRVLIEETGNTCQLIHTFKDYNLSYKSICPSAFFLYNYACYSVKPEECMVLY